MPWVKLRRRPRVRQFWRTEDLRKLQREFSRREWPPLGHSYANERRWTRQADAFRWHRHPCVCGFVTVQEHGYFYRDCCEVRYAAHRQDWRRGRCAGTCAAFSLLLANRAARASAPASLLV